MAQHSNFDRRRINGPESSSHPVFEEQDSEAPSKLLRTSRKNDEIRPICESRFLVKTSLNNDSVSVLQLGLISQANGSAYIETENTKIAVAV
jgi:exosome complex component MTR3